MAEFGGILWLCSVFTVQIERESPYFNGFYLGKYFRCSSGVA